MLILQTMLKSVVILVNGLLTLIPFVHWKESSYYAWDVMFLHEGNLFMGVILQDQASMLREPVHERKGRAIFSIVLFESVSHFAQHLIKRIPTKFREVFHVD